MIPVPNDVKGWLATGYTDMRKGSGECRRNRRQKTVARNNGCRGPDRMDVSSFSLTKIHKMRHPNTNYGQPRPISGTLLSGHNHSGHMTPP
jgi:hypothetical protein